MDKDTINKILEHASVGSKLYVLELTNIIKSDKRYGRSSIPEIEGRSILLSLLPIKDALAQGKDSQLYADVVSSYKRVMHNLFKNQEDMDISHNDLIHYSKSHQRPNLDEIESMPKPNSVQYQFIRHGEY